MKVRKPSLRFRKMYKSIFVFPFLMLAFFCLYQILYNFSSSIPASVHPTIELAGKPVPASLESLERQYYDSVKNSSTKFAPSIPGACRKCSALVPVYSDFIHSGEVQQPKYAYATYISSSQSVAGAALTLYFLALTGTHHARVVIVSPYVTEDEKEFLAHFAWVIVVDLVKHKHYIDNERYLDVFTKLRLWQLTMYTKCSTPTRILCHYAV